MMKNPDESFSVTFVLDEFSGLFLHASIFSIKHSRSGEQQMVICQFFDIGEILIFCLLFLNIFNRFTFLVCCKRMKAIQTIKITVKFRRYSS